MSQSGLPVDVETGSGSLFGVAMRLPVLTSTSGVNHPKSPGLSGQIPDSVQWFARLGGDSGEGSMHREFSILRMKADAATWEYPLSWDEVTKFSPLGAFSELELHRLHCANCCAVLRRTSLDKLLLQRDGNLPLEHSPYLRDAEAPRQIGGGRGVSVRRAAAAQ